MPELNDVIDLSCRLIRCPSVTPEDAGATGVLANYLEETGFRCRRLTFSDEGTPDVDNLYARFGEAAPNFCFAGHLDVVPVGDSSQWSVDPFAAEIQDGRLYGRGASDMKTAVAAFAWAARHFIAERGGTIDGSISFLITGDEEGPAINGTRKVLEWMRGEGETLSHCLVGEPTSVERVGDTVKIGRRGSMNAWVKAFGTQGHAAYPQLADNPIPRLVEFLSTLNSRVLDEGTDYFPPSNLEVTSVDVGNTVTNIIPGAASAQINIRFNDQHTGASLTEFIEETRRAHLGDSELEVSISGEAFLTPPGELSDIVCAAVEKAAGVNAELNATGGTSDARFIKDFCPVVELGVTNRTAHKTDENVDLAEIEILAKTYLEILRTYFGRRE